MAAELALNSACPPVALGCADSPSPQAGWRHVCNLALQQFEFGHGAFHGSGRPAQCQSVHDRGSIRLNAVREADERTKVAGFGVLQPLIEVAHTPTCD